MAYYKKAPPEGTMVWVGDRYVGSVAHKKYHLNGLVGVYPDGKGNVVQCELEELMPHNKPKPSAQPPVQATLEQRGSKYGPWEEHARISQAIKAAMENSPNWKKLKPYQRETLEMICQKVGRILNGDPDYDDNWIDITGYSQLVVNILHGKGI